MIIELPKIDTFQSTDDSKEQALKVLEEASELVEAIKLPDDEAANAHALFEFADVLQALGNLAALRGWSKWQIAMAYLDVKRGNIERGRYE